MADTLEKRKAVPYLTLEKSINILEQLRADGIPYPQVESHWISRMDEIQVVEDADRVVMQNVNLRPDAGVEIQNWGLYPLQIQGGRHAQGLFQVSDENGDWQRGNYLVYGW